LRIINAREVLGRGSRLVIMLGITFSGFSGRNISNVYCGKPL
jgi:hypothetical protein